MRKLSFIVVIGLLVIASCTKKATPTTTKAPTAVNGANIYDQNCSGCHGGTGVEGRAPNLAKTSYTKPEIVSIVTKGQGHMPAFADRLSAQEIDAVAEFVTHLKGK